MSFEPLGAYWYDGMPFEPAVSGNATVILFWLNEILELVRPESRFVEPSASVTCQSAMSPALVTVLLKVNVKVFILPSLSVSAAEKSVIISVLVVTAIDERDAVFDAKPSTSARLPAIEE